MKRVAGLAKRLAATASNARSHLRMMNFSVAPAGGSAGLAAVAVASAAAVATAQWARAEAAQQQPHTQQNEAGSQDESCKECTPDVQLEEQPVAISNSATAQVSPLGQPADCERHRARTRGSPHSFLSMSILSTETASLCQAV